MSKPLIEFCNGNMHHGTEQIMKQLEQDVRLKVIEYGCLGNCGECYLKPFALVAGRITAAESIEDLETRIREAISLKP
ncbi:YuzB family protein [Paenibacillus sp. JDR-2]|uniref:YuzB family protein n=1 Tax=Paenibacillus sp. (strain JDR-2) TaxID=324057 RepID=UPI0002FAEB00|nr:YuzB family protein [Paenibacillus sp. JDR-2]